MNSKIFLLSIFVLIFAFEVMAEDIKTYQDTDSVWSAVQEYRKEKGLKKFENHKRLCAIAEIRVEEVQHEWKHNINNRFTYAGLYRLGENLARNYKDEKSMVQAWHDSESHRKNLQNDYQYSCIRCEKAYCVHIFGDFHYSFF